MRRLTNSFAALPSPIAWTRLRSSCAIVSAPVGLETDDVVVVPVVVVVVVPVVVVPVPEPERGLRRSQLRLQFGGEIRERLLGEGRVRLEFFTLFASISL